MASDPKLIRDWIQFLKNNQIVSMNSDTATGLLKYKKPVTAALVQQFLSTKSDFDPQQISDVIKQVSFGKSKPAAVKGNTPPVAPSAPAQAPVDQQPVTPSAQTSQGKNMTNQQWMKSLPQVPGQKPTDPEEKK